MRATIARLGFSADSPYPPPRSARWSERKEALLQLIEFIGNRPLVGYHIRYDKTILDIACRKHLGFPLPNRLIEVSQIYHDKLEKHLPMPISISV